MVARRHHVALGRYDAPRRHVVRRGQGVTSGRAAPHRAVPSAHDMPSRCHVRRISLRIPPMLRPVRPVAKDATDPIRRAGDHVEPAQRVLWWTTGSLLRGRANGRANRRVAANPRARRPREIRPRRRVTVARRPVRAARVVSARRDAMKRLEHQTRARRMVARWRPASAVNFRLQQVGAPPRRMNAVNAPPPQVCVTPRELETG